MRHGLLFPLLAVALAGACDDQMQQPTSPLARLPGVAPTHHVQSQNSATFVDLGTLGGSGSQANAINNSGTVVGWAQNAQQVRRPFSWQGTQMVDLPTPGFPSAEAEAINDAGVIVGVAFDSNSGDHPIVWQNGVATELPSPMGFGAAFDINDRGDIVGRVLVPPGFARAAIWSEGQLIVLGVLGTGFHSVARAVNEAGQVVGGTDTDCNTNNCRPHAFLWENGVMTDLTPTAYSAGANDINERGQIVGDYMPSIGEQTPTPFQWENGVFTDLSIGHQCANGWLRAINESSVGAGSTRYTCGEVAGIYYAGIIWPIPGTPNFGAFDLNDINQVVGTFAPPTGPNRAARWNVTLNRAPVANAGGPYAAAEGTSIAFDGSGSSDPDGDPVTYAWDFGDGATGTGASPTHAYADEGSYPVTLTVSDGSLTHGATLNAVVSNAPPSVDAGTDAHGTSGVSVSLSGTFSDAGLGDGPWAYSIDWGDGSPSTTGSAANQGAISRSHTYVAPGVYPVTLQITDVDGGTSHDAMTMHVSAPANQAPVPAFAITCQSTTSPTSCNVDASSSTDDGGVGNLWFAWTNAVGRPTKTGTVVKYFWATPGTLPNTFDVTLTATDAGGLTSSVTKTVTIPQRGSNRPPVAAIVMTCQATIKPHSCTLDARNSSDDGGFANLTFTWTNAVGRPVKSGSTAKYTWAAQTLPNTFDVTLTARDGAGLTHATSVRVVIP